MSIADNEKEIGLANLPGPLKNSRILTPGSLARLAVVREIPSIDPSFSDERLKSIFQYFSIDPEEMEGEIHRYANTLLDNDKVDEAWQVLLAVS